MDIALTPTVVDLNGKLMEAYERKTQASKSKLVELGLDTEGDVFANIGVARIREFVVLQAQNIAAGSTRTWSLKRINQSVVIESLFIDAPGADRLDFEILLGTQKIFDFFVNKNQTPYSFPAAPLTPEVSIRIKALTQIKFLRLALEPAIILETLSADEDIST